MWLHPFGYLAYHNQWGKFENIALGGMVKFPIEFTDKCFVVLANDMNSENTSNQVHSTQNYTKSTFNIYSQAVNDNQHANFAYGWFITFGL